MRKIKSRKSMVLFGVICLVLLGAMAVYSNLELRNIALGADPQAIEWQGHTARKLVALTFDDGPDPRFTPQILTILKKYDVPATFFVEGLHCLVFPDLVKQEIREGHIVGNHTFNHPHLKILNQINVNEQIESTDQVIARLIGKKPLYFRPPYEELGGNIIRTSGRLHKKIIMSTVTLERSNLRDPKAYASRVAALIKPDDIILAHDGRVDRTLSVESLPYLIQEVRAKGYQFVPLDYLLQH